MYVTNEHPASRNQLPGHQTAIAAGMQPLFDLTSLQKMLNPSKVAQILSIYLRDAPKEIHEMKCAFDKRAVEDLCLVAHKLKGSSGVIKANNIFALLQQIEATAKTGRVNEGVKIAIDAVDCEYKKVEPLIQAELLRLI